MLSASAPVAQWIERLTTNQEVAGSNPAGRANLSRLCENRLTPRSHFFR